MSDLTDRLRGWDSRTADGTDLREAAADLIDAIDAIASAPVVDSHLVRQIARLIHREDEES